MTHDPIIVSVPHSGTRFLKKRLDLEEHIHTNTNWDTLWDRVHGRPVIVPLRTPALVWRSWCRRRSEVDLLNWLGEFFADWYVMHTLDQMLEIDFICVDKQEDPRIDNWSPVGNKDGNTAHWKLHKADLRPIYTLPLVQRHFGSC